MSSIATRLDELAAWGVDLDLIRLNLSWSPDHRLEVMEGIIQVGIQSRQQTLDPERHADLLRLHFSSPLPLLRQLRHVRVICIGRLAAILQGVPGVSYTLDLCFDKQDRQLIRLVEALSPFTPCPPITVADLHTAMPIEIDTSLVVVRLFPSISGIGDYAHAIQHSRLLDMNEVAVRVLTFDALQKSMSVASDRDNEFFLPLLEATALLQRAA